MNFYRICKVIGLSSNETKTMLRFLIQKFPFGEHAELTKEELEQEIHEWVSDQKWEKAYYTSFGW